MGRMTVKLTGDFQVPRDKTDEISDKEDSSLPHLNIGSMGLLTWAPSGV